MQLHGPMAPGNERREFLEQQPTYWLKRTFQLLRRTVDRELREYGLTLSQRDVLLTLYEDGPLDQSTLRERLGLEQSSVSRVVDGLVRRSLVAIQRSDVDGRVRRATLTDEGRRLLLATPGSSALGGTVMTQHLTAEERREFVRLLKCCAGNLSDHAAARAQAHDRKPEEQ